jgi:hypothetical protein
MNFYRKNFHPKMKVPDDCFLFLSDEKILVCFVREEEQKIL